MRRVAILLPALALMFGVAPLSAQTGSDDPELQALLQQLEGPADPREAEIHQYEQTTEAALGEVYPVFQQILSRYEGVTIELDEADGHIVVVFPNAVLFESGSNFLTPTSERMLRELRRSLLQYITSTTFVKIDVVGHTDTDKRIGDPNYVVIPNNRENRTLAHNPGNEGEVEVDGETVRDWGIDDFVPGRPYRVVRRGPESFVVMNTENGPAREAYMLSYTYNFVLALERAGVIQRYLFDSGDVDSDDNFSQYSQICVRADSRGFQQPVVDNDPLIYRTDRDAIRGRAARRPNRRVELHISVWRTGIEQYIEFRDLEARRAQEAHEEYMRRLDGI